MREVGLAIHIAVVVLLVAACGSAGKMSLSDVPAGDEPLDVSPGSGDAVADLGTEARILLDTGPRKDLGTDAALEDLIPPDALPELAPQDVTNADMEPEDSTLDLEVPPDNCCFTDAMCQEGLICVGGGPGGFPGTCVAPAGEGECWGPSDCSLSEYCAGKQICACDENCPSFPGTCQPILPGCCFVDEMCKPGEICIDAHEDDPGICVAAPAPGICWTDEDCEPGQTCQGAAWCPCGMLCDMAYEGPGECKPLICGAGPGDADGLGKSCPNGKADCEGLAADMCSSGIFSDPTLPPICTMYCSDLVDCGDDAFCIPKGWSSSCIPNECKVQFLNSCVSDLECVVATMWDVCCPCPQAATKAEVEMHLCMFEGADPPAPFPDECVTMCPGVLCEACFLPDGAVCTSFQCTMVVEDTN